MISPGKDIIAQLQKEILPLQGFKPVSQHITGLGPIDHAFHTRSFPLGAVHEFICQNPEGSAATGGFITGLLSLLMHTGGVSLWIGTSPMVFAPSLKYFGVEPDKIIFIRVQKEKDVWWCMEEALKCEGLVAVIGEIKELSFTASRRFQLAVEQSGVTGFAIRNNSGKPGTNACLTRWQITSLPSIAGHQIPGVGFPRWNVELLKVRNGKPGSWHIEYIDGQFRFMTHVVPLVRAQQRKTG